MSKLDRTLTVLPGQSGVFVDGPAVHILSCAVSLTQHERCPPVAFPSGASELFFFAEWCAAPHG